MNQEETQVTNTMENADTTAEALVVGTKKSNSTAKLPMFDLSEAVSFVKKIHDEALEQLAMPEVAKGTGYQHASSTSFYRKMTAARLFGLVVGNGCSELTDRGKDIIKPDSENAKSDALASAISGIKYYSELIAKNNGKRANLDFIANGIARDFSITDECAKTCSRAFMSSLEFAGMLDSNRVVVTKPTKPNVVEETKITDTEKRVMNDNPESELVDFTLYLDKTKTRKIMVKGPISISDSDYRRICDWLKVTFIVEPPMETKTTEKDS